MNNRLFASMQDQLTPDDGVVTQLKARLSDAAPAKKRRPVAAYAAVAACAALALLIYPAYRLTRPAADPTPKTGLHSYVLAEGGAAVATQDTFAGGVAEGGGDTGDPASASSAAPNYGESVPGGAMVEDPTPISSDMAVQEAAVDAYQGLMAYFSANYGPDRYPDWYGGAYVQGSMLIVSVVDANVDESWLMDAGGDKMVGKEFYIQIQDWAGSTAIGFTDGKYSYAYLRELQERVCALPEMKELSSWGCGVNEMTGQVELDVPEVGDALLAALAVLDPADDAILVRAGAHIALTEDALAVGTVNVMDGDPAGYGK